MTRQETVEKLQTAYQRWYDTRGQNVEDWLALMADEIKMRSVADTPDKSAFSAARDGKEEARGYFAALHAEWEMISHPVEEFVADGNSVVVFCQCAFRNRKTGKTAETPLIHRWRFRDGLVVEFYEYFDTAKGIAAATPDPT